MIASGNHARNHARMPRTGSQVDEKTSKLQMYTYPLTGCILYKFDLMPTPQSLPIAVRLLGIAYEGGGALLSRRD